MDIQDITIITVAYNSEAVLPQMLASIPKDVPIVVVDNASSDAEKTANIASIAGATLICNPENRGFGYACNQGAKAAKTQFLLFLNPDSLLQEKTLQALLKAKQTYPDAGAFNPRVLNRKGHQSFRKKSPLLPRSLKFKGPLPQDDCQIKILNGASIFLCRVDFETVGGFDEAIFLYHEDDDLSLQIAKNIGPLMYINSAVVTHLEGRGSARTPHIAAFKAYYMARSRIYTQTKHKIGFPIISTLWRGLFQLLSPEMLFSARKRAKHIAFLKGGLSALKDGGALTPNQFPNQRSAK